MSEPKPRGRQSIYSPELAAKICERMAEGVSLREVCRSEDIPVTEAAVRLWAVKDHDGFASHYARAREAQMEAMGEDIIEISDDSNCDVVVDENGKYIVQGELVQRARLRVDSRKWIMSKIAPKRFGEKVTHGGDPENPLIPEETASTRDIAKAILALLARGAEPPV